MSKLATANPAKANPSVTATIAPTGGGASGGSLPAGSYYLKYTFVDSFGETLAGGVSAQWTIASTNIPRVTLPALPTGVDSINVYITPVGGAVGTERLYATGITTTTFDMSYVAPSDVSSPGLPELNTTGLPDVRSGWNALTHGNSELDLITFSNFIHAFLSAQPIQRREVFRETKRMVALTKLWYTAMTEIATLIYANGPGTYTFNTLGTGMPNPIRTLP